MQRSHHSFTCHWHTSVVIDPFLSIIRQEFSGWTATASFYITRPHIQFKSHSNYKKLKRCLIVILAPKAAESQSPTGRTCINQNMLFNSPPGNGGDLPLVPSPSPAAGCWTLRFGCQVVSYLSSTQEVMHARASPRITSAPNSFSILLWWREKGGIAAAVWAGQKIASYWFGGDS